MCSGVRQTKVDDEHSVPNKRQGDGRQSAQWMRRRKEREIGGVKRLSGYLGRTGSGAIKRFRLEGQSEGRWSSDERTLVLGSQPARFHYFSFHSFFSVRVYRRCQEPLPASEWKRPLSLSPSSTVVEVRFWERRFMIADCSPSGPL